MPVNSPLYSAFDSKKKLHNGSLRITLSHCKWLTEKEKNKAFESFVLDPDVDCQVKLGSFQN